jgi:hypothetical protein
MTWSSAGAEPFGWLWPPHSAQLAGPPPKTLPLLGDVEQLPDGWGFGLFGRGESEVIEGSAGLDP